MAFNLPTPHNATTHNASPTTWLARVAVLLSILIGFNASGDTVPTDGLVNYETPHVHPIDLTPNGNTLLVVNTAGHALEVFDVSTASPTLLGSVPVGLDPVSVRARSNSEAWVVNHLSDSVSIVDLSSLAVSATLLTGNEPADVVFAGSPERAFVSCSEANRIDVFQPNNLTATAVQIPIAGEDPRALAVSPDGTTVYAAIFESGNGTTSLAGGGSVNANNVISRPEGPYSGVNPPPNDGNNFSPAIAGGLGTRPATALIVRKNADGTWRDDNTGDWSLFVDGALAPLSNRVVGWDLPDRDVAIINTANLNVTYQTRLMNIVMALGVNPVSGRVSVVGTEALNEVRFEPNLNGVFLRVNTASFQPGSNSTVTDLNPHLDYSTSTVGAAQRALSIGDPRGIAWRANGSRAYVTGMGSNNVVMIDTNGARLGQFSVGEGPTGIVLNDTINRGYVLNKFDGTVSVLDLATQTEVSQVAFNDPTPQVIKDGRPFLYNTQLTSGLGHVSCGSCHVDGRTDRLAWDLGDPTGSLANVLSASNSNGNTTGTVSVHPMKGPMLTQSLQDIMDFSTLHWRGDRADLAAFNPAFGALMGAPQPLTNDQMNKFGQFLGTIHLPPNPYRDIDNSRPSTITLPTGFVVSTSSGNALTGNNSRGNNCMGCHMNGEQRNDASNTELGQAFVAPAWAPFYDRLGYWPRLQSGSTSGFGFFHDGADDVQGAARTNSAESQTDMLAELMTLEGPDGLLSGASRRQDTHAGVGQQVTIGNSATNAALTRLDQLVAIANSSSHAQLIAKGVVAGTPRGFLHTGGSNFQADQASSTESLASLKSLAAGGTTLTFTVVAEGTGTRLGIDADLDGVLDLDDTPMDTDGDGIDDSVDIDDDNDGIPDNSETAAPSSTSVIDDFNSNLGWQLNPNSSDTATTGVWEIGNPQLTTNGGDTLQLGDGSNGANALITQLAAGSGTGAFDIDNGTTSILSPAIELPAGATNLTFDYYLAHLNNATNADFMRVTLITPSGSQLLIDDRGASSNRSAVWTPFSTDVSAFAGESVNLLIAAADADSGSLIEAGFDHLRVTTSASNDVDNDGIINALDLDSDNDTIPDVIEAGLADSNGDFIVDVLQQQGTVIAPPDSDSDGTPDFLDLDANGNGIFDLTENGLDALDTNNDGRLDSNDTNGGVDANGNGIDDLVEDLLANSAPSLNNPGSQTSQVGAFTSLELVASDDDGDTLTFSASGLPNGLTIDSATGTISGTPAAGGTFNVTASVADGTSNTSVTFDWSVTSVGSQVLEIQVANDDDDAEESTSGRVTRSSSDLELVEVSNGSQVVGIRFPGLNLPSAAVIEDARLVFQVDETDSVATSLIVQAEDADDAANITTADFDLSNRTVTSAAVEWNDIPAWNTVGESKQTPNLAPVVQAVISRGGWVNGNSMMFLIRGTGKRVAEARDGDNAGAPKLIVQYTLDPNANVPPVLTNPGNQTGNVGSSVSLALIGSDANGDALEWSALDLPDGLSINSSTGEISGTLSLAGQYQVTVELSDGEETSATAFSWIVTSGSVNTISVQVTNPDDDAEETSGGGGVGLNSSDLELVEISSGAQVVGIRFTGIDVPAGSVIESATLEFQVDETDSEPTNLQFRAQASDSAEPIITDDGTLSSRATTTAMLNWNNVPAWTTVGAAEATPNFAAIVQEVVSRPGWQNGNAIMILITGSGKRVAESANGSASGAPKLNISYSAGNGNLPPTIGVLANRTDSIDEDILIAVTAGDPDNNPLTFSATGLPPGISIDTFTGELSGTLSALGTFDPTVSVSDGIASTTTTFNWQVVDAGEQTLVLQITNGADDAEEEPDGEVLRRSSDLELGEISSGGQLVALRFEVLDLPPGATITSASLVLQVDERDDGLTDLTLRAEASDNSPALIAVNANLSSRPTGTAIVDWNTIEAWDTVGESQSTPDISVLIQEVVNRTNWQSGNAITLLIDGTGLRVAESADGDASGAPELRLTYVP